MAVDERYMQLPSSLRGPLALISTRSGTRLVRNSFAHFLTRLEKTSPSVQCVAKCSMRRQVPAVSNVPQRNLSAAYSWFAGRRQTDFQNRKNIGYDAVTRELVSNVKDTDRIGFLQQLQYAKKLLHKFSGLECTQPGYHHVYFYYTFCIIFLSCYRYYLSNTPS